MTQDYIIKNIAQADFGHEELDILETEMPGLTALRAECFATAFPRMRIT